MMQTAQAGDSPPGDSGRENRGALMKRFHKILFATDFSESSFPAFDEALALPTAAFAQDQPQGSSNAIITNDAATMPIAAPADTDQMTDQPQGASNSVITNEAALGTTTFPADVDSAQVEVRRRLSAGAVGSCEASRRAPLPPAEGPLA